LFQPIEFRQYRISNKRNSLGYAAGLLLFLASLAACIVGYLRWNFAYSNYGPLVVWRFSGLWFWLGLFLAAIGLWILFRTLRQQRFVVETSRQAMIIHKGKRKLGYAWSEIIAIQLHAVRYITSRQDRSIHTILVLHLMDGSQIKFKRSLQDLDRLIDTCKRMIYPRLLDNYVNLYNRGERLSFHGLSIDREGIHNRRKSIPWKQVDSTRIDQGKFLVSSVQKGRKHNIRLPVSQVYNADLCLQLIEERKKLFGKQG
jgi:hypothetical protein